ncbi:MAG TPA: hypothetical protein VF088_01320 [Pyrinomonadaceae bacterium]
MVSRINLTSITGRHLISGAAVLHLVLAIALFSAGRSGLAPSLIDRDGIMGSFAFDSYDYQRGALELAALLRSGNIVGWASAAQPLHVKIIAIPFAVLSPLFGYSTLSAEPYNLICYVAIIALVFAIGRELCDQRTGVLAGLIVSLWPTFLLHTLQLLKDPIFITAALAFLLCAITSLTRTYRPLESAAVSIVATVLVLLLTVVRFSFVLLMIAVAVLTLLFVILRQARERRLLFGNMAPALAVLLTALLLMPFYSNHSIERTKTYLSNQNGPLKIVADPVAQVPTVVRWIARPESNGPATVTQQHTHAGKFARRISSMRSRFAASYADSGSLLDANAEFRNSSELIRYTPRAMEVGLWAPFPYMWVSAGRRVGNIGKLLSGIETLAIYFLQLLAVAAIVREPRRLALWFVIAVIVFGVTALAFVVPNVGAIYRFRYVLWMLLVVAAMTGLNALITARQLQWIRLKRFITAISIIGLLALVQGCASVGQSSQSANGINPVPLNFTVNNFTGTSFRALYLSPSFASSWQENVLAGCELKDGDALDIKFDPNDRNVEWDMRIEGIDGHYAEWKKLKLAGVSEITLMLKLSPGPVAVAEVE